MAAPRRAYRVGLLRYRIHALRSPPRDLTELERKAQHVTEAISYSQAGRSVCAPDATVGASARPTHQENGPGRRHARSGGTGPRASGRHLDCGPHCQRQWPICGRERQSANPDWLHTERTPEVSRLGFDAYAAPRPWTSVMARISTAGPHAWKLSVAPQERHGRDGAVCGRRERLAGDSRLGTRASTARRRRP